MWKLLLLLLAAAAAADAHHLLCIFALPSKSHHHLGKGIVNALLKGGHEVTWVTAYPPKEVTPNLHVIDGSATLDTIRDFDMNNKRKINAGFSFVRQFAYNVSRATANIPELRKALVTVKYDAVLTETFFSDIDAGFAAVVQAPWIVLSGIVMAPTTERLVDEVKSVATIPLIFNDYPVPMNFWQRWSNLGLYYFLLFEEWWNYAITLERYSEIFAPLAAARGITLPPLEQSLYDISILFVNSHPSFAPAQSLPPNVVDIGGYHIEETKTELPEDLKAILDTSPQGVIYYSMGSVLKSASLPPPSRAAVLRVLGELPYTVLWKFEEELPGVPANVHIRPWMPQPAILAHNHTKAFITHGGLLSNLEALKYGTPLIPMPVFGDQPANAARAVRAGYAATVTPFDPDNVAEPLKLAIQKTMADDKYYKRAKYLSWLFNNRPVPPAKLITHYVELAVESKGAHHLRSKAHLYTWYQRSGLDLLATIFVSLLVVFKLLKFAFCKICAKFCKTSIKKVKRN